MSAISLKSITGITSITTPAGVDNQLTLHTNNTTERVKIDVAGNVHVNNHLSVTGVSTFSDAVNVALGKKINFGNINGTNGHIYYDGSTTRFQTNAGLNIGSPVLSLKSANLGEVMLEAVYNGAVKLWYDYSTYNTPKLQTTATGVTIDGTAVAGGLDISGDIDVDGHTNLDNVSIAGVTTFTGRSDHSSSLQMLAGNNIVLLNDANSANCQIDCYGGAGFRLTSYNQTMFTCENGNATKFYTDNGTSRLEITNGGDVLVNTGTLHIPDALTHLGDTDTKIRFPSADTISFETGGAERLRISSNGNVEMGSAAGTGADFSLLDGMVINTANGSAGLIINSSSSSHNAYLSFGYGSGSSTSHADQYSAYIGRVGDDNLIFGTGNTIRAQIMQSGLFDIIGEARATNFYLRGNGSAPTADASIFRPADNCFAIATGSTERVRVTNDLVNIKGGNLHVGHDNATTNYTDSNGGNTRHIEIGATGGGDALLTTHCSGYGIGYFGYHSGGDRLVIACDQGGGNNSIDLITTAGTQNGGNTDNLHNKNPRFQIRGNGGFRAEYTDDNEVHAISNYWHGNVNYNHRGNRTLTSNGTGWGSNDGSDPMLVLSVANRATNSDIGDAYGIQLHSESQDNDDYGPLIGWTNRSNSGSYNTTYAAIVGQKTGQATDHNWSSGALHFFTNKPGGGGYMSNVADMSIDENGIITMPRNCRFYALNNTGAADSANGGTGKISDHFETELVDTNGDYDTGNGRFTAPVDGAYEFHFAALHRALNNSGSGELTFYKNGSNLSQRSFGYSNIGSGGSTNDHQHLHVHGIFNLSAGDYIEVYIHAQSSGMDFYTHKGLGYFSGKLLG